MDEKKVLTTEEKVVETVKPESVKEDVEMKATSAGSIRKIDNTFTELQAIQSTVKKFKPGDLVIPLLSIFMLALLTTFVYIPMVTSGIKYRDQTKEVNDSINKLKSLSTSLDGMDISTLQTDLSNARAVIPFSLQVSSMLSYLDDSAIANGLSVRTIVAADVAVNASGGNKGVDNVIKGVSGPVKYTGSLSAILRFLGELQVASPYILAADQVKIGQSTDGLWDLSLSVTGYYLNQETLPKVSIYENFTPYTQYTDILGIFNTKAQKLSAK